MLLITQTISTNHCMSKCCRHLPVCLSYLFIYIHARIYIHNPSIHNMYLTLIIYHLPLLKNRTLRLIWEGYMRVIILVSVTSLLINCTEHMGRYKSVKYIKKVKSENLLRQLNQVRYLNISRIKTELWKKYTRRDASLICRHFFRRAFNSKWPSIMNAENAIGGINWLVFIQGYLAPFITAALGA